MQLWTGFVYLQDLDVQVRAVESDDGLRCFGIGLHLNEAESSGQTSPAVSHHLIPPNYAVLVK